MEDAELSDEELEAMVDTFIEKLKFWTTEKEEGELTSELESAIRIPIECIFDNMVLRSIDDYTRNIYYYNT